MHPGFLRLLALPAQLALLQRLVDGRRQALEPVFQQVVGGALLHGRHRDVLADGAGHHDKRNVASAQL